MDKKIIYHSIDDLYFETESECMNHEEEVKEYSVVCDYVTLYTANKKPVTFTSTDISAIFRLYDNNLLSNAIDDLGITYNTAEALLTFEPNDIFYIKIKKCPSDVFKKIKELADFIVSSDEYLDSFSYSERYNFLSNLTDDTIYFKDDLDYMYSWRDMKKQIFGKAANKSKALINWKRYQERLK